MGKQVVIACDLCGNIVLEDVLSGTGAVTYNEVEILSDAEWDVHAKCLGEKMNNAAVALQAPPELTEQSQPVAPHALAMVGDEGPVAEMLRERIQFGKNKYDVTLHTYNGRDPWVDWVQEQLDGVQYLAQMRMESHAIDLDKLQIAKDLLHNQLCVLEGMTTYAE